LIPDIRDSEINAQGSRYLWGFYDVEVVPDNEGSAEVIFTPQRSTQMHMNVVGLMESGSSGAAVGINPPVTLVDGILDVDIKLTHPFPIPKFTGFDVRGILIGHGSVAGFSDSLFYAGSNDMDLLNADGHTRLWNPTEYTGDGYVDGKLGVPDAIANYTATLNGYKYFSDAITTNMDIADMVKSDRGAFTAGAMNIRHYQIKLGDQGLTFQYAIDANWWAPAEPYTVPDDFDIERANCPEPYYVDLWVGPGITGGGGSASFTLDIYDWQKDIDTAYLEAPLLISDTMILTGPEDLGDYVRFSGTLTNELNPAPEQVDILVYARGTDPVSSTVYTDYHLYRLPTPHMPDGGVIITIPEDKSYKTIGIEYTYGSSGYDYGGGNPAPVDYSDTDGPWDFTQVEDDELATREALAPSDPEVAGFAGEFSGNVTHFFKTQMGLGSEPMEVYQAESHNVDAHIQRLWGIYSSEEIVEGVNAFPLDPPIDFQYPLSVATDYTVDESYTIIVFLLTLNVNFAHKGLGEGFAFVPVEPGVQGWGWDVQPALLTRTVAEFETGGVLGQGSLGKALLYQWIADDGTGYGSITCGNSPDEDPNFNESTNEITGSASASALRGID